MSAPLKLEDTPAASSPAATHDESTPESAQEGGGISAENDKKRHKSNPAAAPERAVKKPTEEALQRRREGRIKAAATIAQNLKKTGIGRFEEDNGFAATCVRAVPLINQKNYFADYLKKDDQITVIRHWRAEKARESAAKSAGSDGKRAVADDDENDDDDDENDDDNDASSGKARMGSDTIVLHPGSQNLRVGRATESFPAVVPMVVAVPAVAAGAKTGENSANHEGGLYAGPPSGEYPVLPTRTVYEDGDFDFGDAFAAAKAAVTKDFKARMRYYKRRMMPNSRESAASFNKSQRPEIVPDNSDPDYREFYAVHDPVLQNSPFLVGAAALRVPLSAQYTAWRLRRPIVHGTFNQDPRDYASQQEFICDVTRIVLDALRTISVTAGEIPKLKCLVIIPDFYDKEIVEAWVALLLRSVGFCKVGIIQEAVAATFGAGSSCACVVDVGAQKTTISCVDEGMVINDSRVRLDYGGDNITETFAKLLLQQNFPIQDLNLHDRNDDWELADRLKRNFCTFDDADIAVQLYNFYRRKAGGPTEKYHLKVYDEVMLAPLGLFHPDLFEIPATATAKDLFPESYDHYTGEANNPYSQAQDNLANGRGYAEMGDEKLLLQIMADRQIFKQANAAYGKPVPTRAGSTEDSRRRFVAPLDKAIIESITNAGIATDFNKVKKLYDNILVTGGGLAKFPGFDVLLNDRINIWRPRFLSTSTLDDILSYVSKEKDRLEIRRKQMISDAKEKKKKGAKKDAATATAAATSAADDVELSEQELSKIDAETALKIDLQKADAVADDGSVIAVNVLPAPKELDPELIAWTGGSVYGRLKVVNEMWITKDDWEVLNSRCLYYKSLFNY